MLVCALRCVYAIFVHENVSGHERLIFVTNRARAQIVYEEIIFVPCLPPSFPSTERNFTGHPSSIQH